MGVDILGLILSLAIILISCELFTNGIEWLGKELKAGEGVVGSIFSAVGTCLPETIVPVIAILFSAEEGNVSDSVDIGIGAIMGAPFMLSTIAFFLTGASVLAFWRRRKSGMYMLVNNKIMSRDISFFIIVYCIGLAAAFIDSMMVKYIIAALLVLFYLYYIFLTVKEDRESHDEPSTLYIVQYLNMKLNMRVIVFQIVLALMGIIFGAELFVENIKHVSGLLEIPVLVLSLIITPIATELPEKFNSIIWISRRKDTLALGNITGAMVFQSCIPVSIGVSTTPWKLAPIVLMSAILSILSAAFTYGWIKVKGKLSPIPLLTGGAFYAMFLLYFATTFR